MRIPTLLACAATLAALSCQHDSADPAAVPRSQITADSAFAAKLLAHLAHADGGNLVFSPSSIRRALGMLREGARGATRAEIDAVAGFGAEPAEVGDARVTIVDAVWIDESFTVEDGYVDRLGANGAVARQIDFAGDPDASRERINAFVAERTSGQVSDLAPVGSIVPLTRVVVTSVVRFAAPWADALHVESEPRPFHAPAGAVDRVFASGTERLRCVRRDGATAVAMPFQGERFAMVFVLPEPGETRRSTDADLELIEEVRRAERRLVRISMPRFEIRSSPPVEDALRELGVRRVFSDDANLTGIAPEPLHVSHVLHEAIVRVDEHGAEASAATALFAEGDEPSEEPIRFVLDRPFLFAIVDRTTGGALFLGRCVRP